MEKPTKTHQLQIRVSGAEKKAIRRQAELANMGMSEFVLSRLLPPASRRFHGLLDDLAAADKPAYALAELNDLLSSLTAEAYEQAVAEPPRARLDRYREAYVAAMVEHAAAKKGAKAPAWAVDVRPLDEPAFGSSLESLRLHLLVSSPPAFRRRNIFIDSSIGERV